MELVFFIVIIIACIFIYNLRQENKITESVQDYIIEESSKTEEEPKDEFKMVEEVKKVEEPKPIEPINPNAIRELKDLESGLPSLIRAKGLTKEQKDFYMRYRDTFCQKGKTEVKRILTNLAKEGNDAAKGLRLVLEIGDCQNEMIENKQDFGFYGFDAISKKEKAIYSLIKYCKDTNSKWGISYPQDNTLCVCFFMVDGFPVATNIRVTDMEFLDNSPRIPKAQEIGLLEEVTIEDILPRLEGFLIRKGYVK